MKLHIPATDEENLFIAAWAAAELGVTFSSPYIALASTDHRAKIIGAAILNEYDGNNVSVSVTGEGAFTPSVVTGLARYIFVKLDCSRMTLRTRRSNHRARKLLNKHFKAEATLKNWFGNEDAFQFRMCRNECPWLRKTHDLNSVASRAA